MATKKREQSCFVYVFFPSIVTLRVFSIYLLCFGSLFVFRQVTGISWDDGCHFCGDDQCEENAYTYDGELIEGAGSGKDCYWPDSECLQVRRPYRMTGVFSSPPPYGRSLLEPPPAPTTDVDDD